MNCDSFMVSRGLLEVVCMSTIVDEFPSAIHKLEELVLRKKKGQMQR